MPAFRAFDIQPPKLSIPGRQLAKVSGPARDYSRFPEIAGGDRFDHDYRPHVAVKQVAASGPGAGRIGRRSSFTAARGPQSN